MRTPKGEGVAIMVIDYGPDYDLFWTVIVSKGEHAGEIWTYPNPQVRGVENVTLGRHVAPADGRPMNGHGPKGISPEIPLPSRLGLSEKPTNGQRHDPLSSRLPGSDD
jgi:hypothetical protein